MNNDPASSVQQLELRLVAQAADGDRAAQRELFERFRSAAYRAAVRITGREEDALDVVQDSFIKAFERLDQFRGSAAEGRGSGFKTWLLRIVTNRALDLIRARRVRMAASLDADDDQPALEPAGQREAAPGAAMEQAESAARVQAALDRLPPDQRAVIALYATGDMTYAQIAETLGIPIGTVMSRLYHARRRLQEWLPDLVGQKVSDKE